MKYVAIAMILTLPIQALGECSHAPFELIWSEKYRNGGTISVTVADSAGCVVGFSMDRAIKSETWGRLFFRVIKQDGTDQVGAKAGIASQDEEEEILALLSLVADSKMSRPRQMKFLKDGWADFPDDDLCPYFGWLMELLQAMGWR